MAARPQSLLRLAEGVPPSDKSEATTDLKDANVVILRLHNNTSWTVGFPTESMYVGPAVTAWSFCDGTGVLGLRDGIEANARYEVELLEGNTTPTNSGSVKQLDLARSDISSTSWLPPGRAVIIPVLKDHLKKGLAIYLPFNYEWETEKRHVRGDEAQHRVYFHFWNLPENVRPK